MTKKIWYQNPARKWTEALPIGNGRLGAMHFGGVAQDHLQLNEESLWDGFRRDRNNPQALAGLAEVRKLLFAGRNHEAEALAGNTMLGIPPELDSYQPLGDLRLTFHHAGAPAHYRRELDLDAGMTRVEYQLDGVSYRREILASAPDAVIVIRLTCSQPGRLHLDVSLAREQAPATATSDGRLHFSGQCGERGVRFAAEVRGVMEGGRMSPTDGGLHIEGADAVTLLVAGATDYRGGEPVRLCEDALARAMVKPYAELRQAHVADHQRLFHRVDLDLGGTDAAARPLEERLEAVKQGAEDPDLCALLFHYLRYLLIASSRPGSLPSNLQGIWNDQMKAPWNSDYHPNINLQMNYWPVEVCNLAECHTPLFDWMETLVEPGGQTAEKHYGARGWVLHHISDIWGCTTPMDGVWGVWPMGGAWLCRHLWEHYAYGGDEQFLTERAYPLMKGAARFLLDFLVEVPSGLPFAGRLTTNPSHSPENAFSKADGTQAQLTHGATMDLEIIHDLFGCTREAIARLPAPTDEDRALRAELQSALDRLIPLQISPRTGGLQEWVEDYDEPEPGHRHISHMYGLYPAAQISLQRTTAFAVAAKASLERRLGNDYHPTGWSLAWMMHLWARLLEPERAYAAVKHYLAEFTLPNLMTHCSGHTQVGDAEGFASGIAELLLQSHLDEIRLLPALPRAWPRGAVSGLRARGGFEVDMEWEDGRLRTARIRSLRGGRCQVRATHALQVWDGERRIEVRHPEPAVMVWETSPGITYQLEHINGSSIVHRSPRIADW